MATRFIATVDFSNNSFKTEVVGSSVSESAAGVIVTVACALPAPAPNAVATADFPAVLALPDKLPLNVGAVIPTSAITPCDA